MLVGCGHAAQRPLGAAPSPFSYDASQPLRLVDRGRANRGYPIAVRDVSFSTPSGRVDAYLVVPPRRGRLPGVVYVHGSGGDRRELLVPATWLAARAGVAEGGDLAHARRDRPAQVDRAGAARDAAARGRAQGRDRAARGAHGARPSGAGRDAGPVVRRRPRAECNRVSRPARVADAEALDPRPPGRGRSGRPVKAQPRTCTNATVSAAIRFT